MPGTPLEPLEGLYQTLLLCIFEDWLLNKGSVLVFLCSIRALDRTSPN
jgi:hypothetical protein